MRGNLPKGVGLAVVLAAATVAACTPTYTNSNKKMTREDVAIDALDCQKAAVLKYKATRLRQSDSASPEARQAAYTASRAAWDQCLKSRGWKKNT
jgi:hypothetical protein